MADTASQEVRSQEEPALPTTWPWISAFSTEENSFLQFSPDMISFTVIDKKLGRHGCLSVLAATRQDPLPVSV